MELFFNVVFILCLLVPVKTHLTSNIISPMDSLGTTESSLLSLDGVVGKKVELPCGITPNRRDDTVYMVLWFRGEESIPIYSLDVRGKPFSGAKHWSAEVPFGKRAHFRTVSEPAKLVIEDGVVSDQGIYRCRVDFRNSPSRETRLNLTIIVPPEEPLIFDSSGLSVRGEVGPFREGASLDLTCIVRGGVPSPVVYWYLNDELIDSSHHVEREREVINHVLVPNIQRTHHHTHLTCRASNTLLLPPISKSLTIELNLRPLTVSILHRHVHLTTELEYEIRCESSGSHPQPLISWWMDGKEIRGGKIEESSRGSNTSISTLLLSPTGSNDGELLVCRAENPLLAGSAIEDSWRLRVVYAPLLSLRMGSSLNPNDIKEGDDVYFECLIKANPPVHKLTWYHNGDLLSHNRTSGIILSNQSLVLQKVSRPSAGNYSCKSSNSQGVGISNSVSLEIMYAPTCETNNGLETSPQIVAVSRGENVSLNCSMRALPFPLKFHWTFTNSVGESSEIGSENYRSTTGRRSILTYNLRTDEDFGALLCWASNAIGTAESPCVYQLVPADIPQSVENCSIVNRTSSSVELTCEPGFDGGLPQLFILEVYQSSPLPRPRLLFNLSSTSAPSFSLSGLDPEGTFTFRIWAANRKGRSSPILLDAVALHYPAMQSAKAQEFQTTTIAIIIGALAAVGVTLCAILAFIVHRRLNPISHPSENLEKSYVGRGSRRSSTQEELYGQGNTKLGQIQNNSEISPRFEYDDDGDPDLIPSKNIKIVPGVGSAYSRVSNGEINCKNLPNSHLDSSPLPNYGTLRTSNGSILKKNEMREMVDMSSFGIGTVHGKPASMVVSIDTRLIGHQLASSQLPESCV